MRERAVGSIVLVVGNDGIKPSYWEMTAGAANAADLNFCVLGAEQYGPLGIRVQHGQPGPGRHRPLGPPGEGLRPRQERRPERAHELALGSIPLGRICTRRRSPTSSPSSHPSRGVHQRRPHPGRRCAAPRRSWTGRCSTSRRIGPRLGLISSGETVLPHRPAPLSDGVAAGMLLRNEDRPHGLMFLVRSAPISWSTRRITESPLVGTRLPSR